MIRIIYILSLLTFIFIGCEDLFKNDTTYGCIDESACNYSSLANTSDPDLCIYPLDNFDCNDVCVAEIDDCGICGGSGVDVDLDSVCDDIDPCIGVSNDGYYCSDIHVIFDFINYNSSIDSSFVLNGNIYSYSDEDIGITNWEDGRLTYLSLANLDLDSVPSSIENLSALQTLFLNNNNLDSLPLSLCNLPASCDIYVQDNNLCAEYGEWSCINQFNPQDCQE